MTMAIHNPNDPASRPAEATRLPFSSVPEPSGLYDPRFEHDACGVSFVVDIKGRAATTSWRPPSARCATSTTAARRGPRRTPATAPGILIQVPDAFLRAVVDFDLPRRGAYGVGLCFLPPIPTLAARPSATDRAIVAEEGLRVLGWREVPIDDSRSAPRPRA